MLYCAPWLYRQRCQRPGKGLDRLYLELSSLLHRAGKYNTRPHTAGHGAPGLQVSCRATLLIQPPGSLVGADRRSEQGSRGRARNGLEYRMPERPSYPAHVAGKVQANALQDGSVLTATRTALR